MLLSVSAHPKRWNASDVWSGHFRRYERKRLEDLVQETGLSVVHFESYGFPFKNLLDPFRARYHARQFRRQNVAGDREHTSATNTARSGIERPLESRLFRLQASWVGVLITRFAYRIQALFAGTDWGSGYLVLARRL